MTTPTAARRVGVVSWTEFRRRSVGGGQVALPDVLEQRREEVLLGRADRGILGDLREAEGDHPTQLLLGGLVEIGLQSSVEAPEEHLVLGQRPRCVQVVLLEHEEADLHGTRLLATAEVFAILVDDDAVGVRRVRPAQGAGSLGRVGDDGPPTDLHPAHNLADVLRLVFSVHRFLLRDIQYLPDFSQNVKG